jgi:hypothetical protein
MTLEFVRPVSKFPQAELASAPTFRVEFHMSMKIVLPLCGDIASALSAVVPLWYFRTRASNTRDSNGRVASVSNSWLGSRIIHRMDVNCGVEGGYHNITIMKYSQPEAFIVIGIQAFI